MGFLSVAYLAMLRKPLEMPLQVRWGKCKDTRSVTAEKRAEMSSLILLSITAVFACVRARVSLFVPYTFLGERLLLTTDRYGAAPRKRRADSHGAPTIHTSTFTSHFSFTPPLLLYLYTYIYISVCVCVYLSGLQHDEDQLVSFLTGTHHGALQQCGMTVFVHPLSGPFLLSLSLTPHAEHCRCIAAERSRTEKMSLKQSACQHARFVL
jgi:hypothetical protein